MKVLSRERKKEKAAIFTPKKPHFQCARRDSNPQPTDSKSVALSIELRAQDENYTRLKGFLINPISSSIPGISLDVDISKRVGISDAIITN